MQATQTNKGVLRRSRPAKGGKGSIRGQEQISSTCSDANAFMKQRFLPLCHPTDMTTDKLKREKGFFESLSRLAEFYRFTPLDVRDKPYPYNILLAHWDAELKIRAHRNTEILFVQDGRKYFLVTRQTCNISDGLYYIPVEPLYLLKKSKTRKELADLLTSVYSFFYRKAQVPYYMDESSELFCQYDQAEEWICDGDGGDENPLMETLEECLRMGLIIEKLIGQPKHLNLLEKRIAAFKPATFLDYQVLMLAKDVFQVIQDYPGRSLFTLVNYEIADLDYYDEVYAIDHILSFVASKNNWIYTQIEQWANDTVGNANKFIQPEVIVKFDRKPEAVPPTLFYEQKVFGMVGNLMYILSFLQ